MSLSLLEQLGPLRSLPMCMGFLGKLDTTPGRRKDGHAPGGNSIDTVSHPVSNLLLLDAGRVNETVIAHELGHAWVQYVDECEDLRTLEDATDPQRIRQVNFVQSFVLDLKVNDLIHRKGFDMAPIEEDQAASVEQLAHALRTGYQPESPREEIFMSLLVADQMLQRENGRCNELARFDDFLESIRLVRSPIADLGERMADSVRRHGYDSRFSIEACIDECLLASFEHCGERFDLDRELVLVNPEEPDIDKFPRWLPVLPPKLKSVVGRHMAESDISSDWAHSISPTLAGRTRVTFYSPDRGRSEVIVPHRIGPPTPYFGMSENLAEMLELKRQNEERRNNSIPKEMQAPMNPKQVVDFNEKNRNRTGGSNRPPFFQPHLPKQPGRPYMAGLGRFLTAARLAEQIAGEHPYGYAFCNPTTYVDPSGLEPCGQPQKSVTQIGLWPPCGPQEKAYCTQLCVGKKFICLLLKGQTIPRCFCIPRAGCLACLTTCNVGCHLVPHHCPPGFCTTACAGVCT